MRYLSVISKLEQFCLSLSNCFVDQEKITALQAELQVVTNSKAMLEKELQEVITLTSTELEEYQEKVLELEDEVRSLGFYVCDAVHARVIIDSALLITLFFPSASRVQMLQKTNPKVRRCQQKVSA